MSRLVYSECSLPSIYSWQFMILMKYKIADYLAQEGNQRLLVAHMIGWFGWLSLWVANAFEDEGTFVGTPHSARLSESEVCKNMIFLPASKGGWFHHIWLEWDHVPIAREFFRVKHLQWRRLGTRTRIHESWYGLWCGNVKLPPGQWVVHHFALKLVSILHSLQRGLTYLCLTGLRGGERYGDEDNRGIHRRSSGMQDDLENWLPGS